MKTQEANYFFEFVRLIKKLITNHLRFHPKFLTKIICLFETKALPLSYKLVRNTKIIKNMSLKTKLDKSLNEKDVENIYRSELDKIEESIITSPYGVDGLIETKNIRSLLEFKYEEKIEK